jgi:hypothetical protein
MATAIPLQFMAQPSATGATNSTATAGRTSQTPPPFPTQPPPSAQQQYRSVSAERVMGHTGQRQMQMPMPPFQAAFGFRQQNVNWGRNGNNEVFFYF